VPYRLAACAQLHIICRCAIALSWAATLGPTGGCTASLFLPYEQLCLPYTCTLPLQPAGPALLSDAHHNLAVPKPSPRFRIGFLLSPDISEFRFPF